MVSCGPMIHRTLLILALLLPGCTPGQVASALDVISRGAQWLGTVLDVARGGADAYFNRHPNPLLEEDIAAAERRTRLALATLEGLIAAGAAANQNDLSRARDELLKAYESQRRMLDEAGVLDARSPAGGADAMAPEPEPVILPSVNTVAAGLSMQP